MHKWTHYACIAGILALSIGQANAASFEMGDHPDSVLWKTNGQGPYGYRLDNFGALFSVGDNILTTSQANVVINFDPGNLAAGATVTGIIQMTYKSSNYQVADLWTINYTLSDLVAYNGGFAANAGIGSIVDLTPGDIDNSFDEVKFIGKDWENSGFVFIFAPDGHRLDGYPGYADDTWVARGATTGYRIEYEYKYVEVWDSSRKCWVKKKVKVEVIKKKRWDGTNDFLMVSGTGSDIPDVPEPSTILLTLGGVGLLALRKRRS